MGPSGLCGATPAEAAGQTCCVFEICEQVIVRQKEALDGTVENNNLYMLISFECGDNLIQLRNGLRSEDIQGRVIKRNSPVGWRTSFKTDLSGILDAAHVCPLFRSHLNLPSNRIVGPRAVIDKKGKSGI
jgi:hypothetical protein